MCGIAGIVGAAKDRREILRAMTTAIAHRGPDGEGSYYDDFAALGHRRLAVIDLSDSAGQPMESTPSRRKSPRYAMPADADSRSCTAKRRR